jgi:deoxyribonuclease V
VAIQKNLREKLVLSDCFSSIQHVAGIDVGFDKAANVGRAAVVVFTFPGLEVVETAIAELPLAFPYLPGLLSFREIPVILPALKKLKTIPDLLLCDGQGTAHPRRFGVACHLGLLTDIPAAGVGKTRLTGVYEEPGMERGCWAPLLDKGEIIGSVVRTRAGVKPVFVSPGHKISLESSVKLVMQCVGRYRLPETTRYAHHLSQVTR